jgi:hypothetical protein
MGDASLTLRKTLAQMQAEANGGEPMQIAGKPADVCPQCGAGMFAYRTETLTTRIDRYVRCRNESCGKRFVSRQPQPQPPVLVREISNGGTEQLIVFRETA